MIIQTNKGNKKAMEIRDKLRKRMRVIIIMSMRVIII